jgi:hypothetical protein
MKRLGPHPLGGCRRRTLIMYNPAPLSLDALEPKTSLCIRSIASDVMILPGEDAGLVGAAAFLVIPAASFYRMLS